jgi:hypothetical protein
VIGRVSDIDVAMIVDGDGLRAPEAGVAAQPVDGPRRRDLTGQGGDHAIPGDFPNGMIVRVGDEEGSVTGDGNAPGLIEPGRFDFAIGVSALFGKRTRLPSPPKRPRRAFRHGSTDEVDHENRLVRVAAGDFKSGGLLAGCRGTERGLAE